MSNSTPLGNPASVGRTGHWPVRWRISRHLRRAGLAEAVGNLYASVARSIQTATPAIGYRTGVS